MDKSFNSTADGQKVMAAKAGRIGMLLNMNRAIRNKCPENAYSNLFISNLPESMIDSIQEELRQIFNTLHKNS